MPRLSKFIEMGGLAPRPPKNLLEVLERGTVDTFPIHTALWLFKNAEGDTGAFRSLPGPEFGYRVRDPKVRSTSPNNGAVTLKALAWFLCQPAYGQGYLAAGPTAPIYGGLADGFLVPPMTFPASPADFSEEVRDLLAQATFPLSDLPAMNRRHIEFFFALMFMKSSCIFGPQETQLLRRASFARWSKEIPKDVERDLQHAINRAAGAFDMPARRDWDHDQRRREAFIKNVRCSRLIQIRLADEPRERADGRPRELAETSPYSPPYCGLPIFDIKPLYAEALRLVKVIPDHFDWCEDLYFMAEEDWRRLQHFRRMRMFPNGQGDSGAPPKNADYRAAWDWVESIYGLRVRAALHPSDRDHKPRRSSPQPSAN